MKLTTCISALLLGSAAVVSGKKAYSTRSVKTSGYKQTPVVKENPLQKLQVSRKEFNFFPRVRRPQEGLRTRALKERSPYTKRAGQHTLYSAETMCGNTANSFDTFRCYSDDDCSNWLSLHGDNTNLYYSANPNSEMFQFPSAPMAVCERGQCSIVPLVPEGETCLGSGPDLCDYPNSCSSSVCQTPIVGGCGNCSWDPSSCIIGTACSSQRDQCVEHLEEGDSCVYAVGTVKNGWWGTYTDWTQRFYPCGIDIASKRLAVPNLECDVQSGVCVRQLHHEAKAGEPCTDPYSGSGGCGAGLYCTDNYDYSSPNPYICAPFAGEGDSCDIAECAEGLICETDSYTCRAPHSVPKGGVCLTKWGSFGADDLCQDGLVCINAKCDVPLTVNDEVDCTDENTKCAHGLVCDASTQRCIHAFSKQAGESCGQVSWDTLSPCAADLTCSQGVCTAPAASPCNAGLCRNDDTLGLCECDDPNPSSAESPASCHSLSADVVHIYPSMAGCMYTSGFNFDSSYSPIDNPNFGKFLCCMLCEGAEENHFWQVHSISEYIRHYVYGTDGKHLYCNNDNMYGSFMEREGGWCDGTARFDLSAMKSIAKCPGADYYYPGPPKDRIVDTPPGGDPFECGLRNCGGKGHCFNNEYPVCYCDEGSWGPACEYSEETREAERSALKEFFIYTNGFSWKNVDGWCKEGVDLCDSYGVTCNAFGSVIGISLPFNNLMGSLQPSISQLSNLRTLNLRANFLKGSIPSTLYDLTDLVYLDLAKNYLTGSLAVAISQLSHLRHLDVSGNKFSGSIPETLPALDNLEVLLLQRNQFTGALPMASYKFESVVKLDFTNNQLDADVELPTNICPRCERYLNKCGALGCQNCRDGTLLGCTNPDALPDRINMTDPDGPNGEDQYPLFHKCGYYYG